MAITGQDAATLHPAEGAGARLPVSARDLTRSMLLLRASNMSVMRLQLAIERRDRRRAMEALDGLVALDGEIRGLIEGMPAADGAFAEMARRIDDQKAVLASEKLVFAAGTTGPALARPAPVVVALAADPGSPEGRSLDRPSEDEAAAPPEADWATVCAREAEEQAPPPGRRIRLAVTALLLAAGMAAGAYFFGGGGSALPPPVAWTGSW